MLHKSPLLGSKGVQAYITKLLPNPFEGHFLHWGLEKYLLTQQLKIRSLSIKKGSRFHASLIKSIAFPQKLLKRTAFE